VFWVSLFILNPKEPHSGIASLKRGERKPEVKAFLGCCKMQS